MTGGTLDPLEYILLFRNNRWMGVWWEERCRLEGKVQVEVPCLSSLWWVVGDYYQPTSLEARCLMQNHNQQLTINEFGGELHPAPYCTMSSFRHQFIIRERQSGRCQNMLRREGNSVYVALDFTYAFLELVEISNRNDCPFLFYVFKSTMGGSNNRVSGHGAYKNRVAARRLKRLQRADVSGSAASPDRPNIQAKSLQHARGLASHGL